MTATRSAFADSIAEFEAASPWLGAEHAPALAMLRALASEMDGGGLTAALASAFGLTYRNLAKLAPKAAGEPTDPLAEALRNADAAI